MEVCVDSLDSVIAAHQGGADRVELCSSLNEGGLTPSFGLVTAIQKYLAQNDPERKFQVNCMVRCRPGDFLYSDREMETMIEDAKKFTELEVNALVFGALTPQVRPVQLAFLAPKLGFIYLFGFQGPSG